MKKLVLFEVLKLSKKEKESVWYNFLFYFIFFVFLVLFLVFFPILIFFWFFFPHFVKLKARSTSKMTLSKKDAESSFAKNPHFADLDIVEVTLTPRSFLAKQVYNEGLYLLKTLYTFQVCFFFFFSSSWAQRKRKRGLGWDFQK